MAGSTCSQRSSWKIVEHFSWRRFSFDFLIINLIVIIFRASGRISSPLIQWVFFGPTRIRVPYPPSRLSEKLNFVNKKMLKLDHFENALKILEICF